MQDKTLAESGFYWRESNGIRVLICGPLDDAGFVNGFSTRLGGVSQFPNNDLNLAGYDEDLAVNIEENRRRFLSVFEGTFDLTTAWQVHGSDIKIVRDSNDAANTEERFDSLASGLSGLLIGVKTADCVPVLIGDPKTGAFAAIHAGWRGTVNSITAKAVDALAAQFGAVPADLVCAIGPAACGRNYEIGQDVLDAFQQNIPGSGVYFTPTRPGHALVDLHAANRDQLLAKGVRTENVFIAPFCTIERTDLFFSYRVEKQRYGKTGRLMSVIGRKPD